MVKKFTFDDEDDDFAYDNDLKEQNNDFDDHLHDTSHEDPKETEYINSHSTQNKPVSKKQKPRAKVKKKTKKKTKHHTKVIKEKKKHSFLSDC